MPAIGIRVRLCSKSLTLTCPFAPQSAQQHPLPPGNTHKKAYPTGGTAGEVAEAASVGVAFARHPSPPNPTSTWSLTSIAYLKDVFEFFGVVGCRCFLFVCLFSSTPAHDVQHPLSAFFFGFCSHVFYSFACSSVPSLSVSPVTPVHCCRLLREWCFSPLPFFRRGVFPALL